MISPTRAMLLAGAVGAGACAAPISGFHTAHVPQKGALRGAVGGDVLVPTGTLSRTVEAGEALVEAARNRALEDKDQRKIVEAGTNLALSPPAVLGHAQVAYAPLDRWEVGVGAATSGALRLGGRTQILDQSRDGWDLSVGLGVQRLAYEFPVDKVLDILELEDFVRWSLDVPVTAGRRGDFYRVWAGPRLIVFQQEARFVLNLPKVADTPGELVLASVDGRGALVGLQGGAAVGYKVVFVAFELTVARLFSTAHLNLAGLRTDVELDGWIISPGLALIAGF
jgi:hypothetical protein